LIKAVYPGSFDPITLGHLNIIRRAAKLFDELTVCVMINSAKTPLFSIEERVELISRCTARFGNVRVEAWDDLAVRFATKVGASTILRGLRAVSDFDEHVQQAIANKKIEPDIETMFMASSERYAYLSSTVVKEMARYGVDISEFAPKEIIGDILSKVKKR